MRVELDITGKLIIYAESHIESFALSHWWQLWSEKKAVLGVECVKEIKKVDPPELET